MCSTCEPKFLSRISLLHKYWFMPAAYAIDRSVPRKTSRSKPDSTPEIWPWWLAVNFSTAFPLSFEDVLFANAPHPTRAETPQSLVAATPRCDRCSNRPSEIGDQLKSRRP